MNKHAPPSPSSAACHVPADQVTASQPSTRSLSAHHCSSPFFKLGPMIALLPYKLYLRFHKDEAETIREITRHTGAFSLSCAHDQYKAYCSDFGPIDLGKVVEICRELHKVLEEPRMYDRPVIYYSYQGHEQTNAAFALAAFLLLVEGRTPEEAWAPFARVKPSPWVSYRDATHQPSTCELSILDCLRGLARGREQGFFSLEDFDVDGFRANEELGVSKMCPKFVAFKGPNAGPQRPSWAQEPAAYMEALVAAGVTDVVRLNEALTYDAREFTERGIAHHDLEFPDCTNPDLSIVLDFMRICSTAAGAVGVHCRAGLGRTGTLIGIWLMSKHGWSARETIGWLRLVRPGSVIGSQQHCLVAV